MTYYYTLEFPADGASSVEVTGNFDDWNKSNPPLIKDDKCGKFKGVIKLDRQEKLVFKFIVDGDWKLNALYKVEHDDGGMENNYVDAHELKIMEQFEQITKDQDDAKSGDNIHQVLTSSSSFAAVSIPEDEGAKAVSGAEAGAETESGTNESAAAPGDNPNLSDSLSTLNTPQSRTSLQLNSIPNSASNSASSRPKNSGLVSRMKSLFRS